MKRSAGFTLIELMIVVTLISIIATIAIPSLLRARMSANEVAAISALKTIATEQTTFRRQDYSFATHVPNVREYAVPFTHLYQLDYDSGGSGGEVLQFVDESVAAAHFFSAPNPTPKAGYYFHDVLNRTDASGSAVPVDRTVSFAVFAAPAQYNLTGLNSFFMDDKGVIWQRDTGEGVSESFLMSMPRNPAHPPYSFINPSY